MASYSKCKDLIHAEPTFVHTPNDEDFVRPIEGTN